jgi:two-component system NtrC family sensor kinase
MKKLVILCYLLKTQFLLNDQLTVPERLGQALMVCKNDTNNVGLLNALDGAHEFTFADINALADENLRIADHGLKVKDNDFNAELKTDFDNLLDRIKIMPRYIGRILLNLYNNTFYAMNERSNLEGTGFYPTVSVITKKMNGKEELTVKDSGNGIPQNIFDKIFQPFFTTKPIGQGTGLGLSLSYDIIKAHGDIIEIQSTENTGTTFIITLKI